MFSGESVSCLTQKGWKRRSLLEREVESRRNRSTDCSYLEQSYMEGQHGIVRKAWILESGNLDLLTCSTLTEGGMHTLSDLPKTTQKVVELSFESRRFKLCLHHVRNTIMH